MQAAAPPKRKSEEETEGTDASKASRAPKLPSGESTTTDTIGFECACASLQPSLRRAPQTWTTLQIYRFTDGHPG